MFDTDISKINESKDKKLQGKTSQKNFLIQGEFDVNAIPKILKEVKQLENQNHSIGKRKYSKRAQQMYLEIKNLAKRNLMH